MRIAVPDLVSSSYFPALAATRLVAPGAEAPAATIEHLYPIRSAVEALRDGAVEFVAGPAHATLFAFPGWQGAKIAMALSQHTYWLLVARVGLDVVAGDPGSLRGATIAAAPGPGHALRQLLADAHVDPVENEITIGPLPASHDTKDSFGIMAARALTDGAIDAFWANSMAAEIAVREGAGKVVLDPRRGDGGPEAANYTFPALITTDALLRDRPEETLAVVRGVLSAQARLREDPSIATSVADGTFPELESSLIAELIGRDAPYYSPEVDRAAVDGLNHFTVSIGMTESPADYDQIVAAGTAALWSTG